MNEQKQTWVYMLHPLRDDFAATMTSEEQAVWGQHFAWLDGLLEEGSLILAGASGGTTNTGLALIEAADEQAARAIVANDPVAHSGYARPDLRPFSMGLTRL